MAFLMQVPKPRREESRGSRGKFVLENFEFLDLLELYFTYFWTRFEEKLQPQKNIIKSPNVVTSKKYFCKTLYCTR